MVFSEDIDSNKDPTSDERRYRPGSGSAGEESQETKGTNKSGKSLTPRTPTKPTNPRNTNDKYAEQMVVPQSRKSLTSNTLMVPGQPSPSNHEEEQEDETFTKQIQVLNIPIVTYSQLKNMKAMRENLEEDIEVDDEDPSNREVLDEQVDMIAELGEEIMNDLQENNQDNPFIQEMKEEIKAISQKIDGNKKSKNPDELKRSNTIKDLIEWQKKLNKLEVKDPTINKNEKKKMEDIARRKSFQALVIGPQDQESISPEAIRDGRVSNAELKDYVKKFLDKYAEKMKSVDTPLSKTLAQEAEDCNGTIDYVEETRSPDQAKELNKLLATSICTKFKPRKNNGALGNLNSEQPQTDTDVLEFNDLLRTINELSKTPFKELDNIVHDPSTKFNLLRMRNDKMNRYPESKYDDKVADILLLNELEADKPVIEELIRNIGKDALPPRVVQKDSNRMTDSRFSDMDMQINFIPLGRDSIPKNQSVVELTEIKTNNINSDDSFGGDIKFTPAKYIEDEEDYKDSPLQKRISLMTPNMIDSEDGVSDSSISNDKPSGSGRTENLEIDYREDLADKLEIVIEAINNNYGDIRLARQDLKHHNKSKRVTDDKKLEFFEQVSNFLDECNSLTKEGDKYKSPYEELKNEIIEVANPDSSTIPSCHNKGLIKMWGKYKRHIRKLKSENLLFLEEIQQSQFMRPENNADKQEELESLKEQLEDVHNAIAQEYASEEKESPKKPIEHPIMPQKRMSISEIKKLAEEDQKKHESMEKRVGTLSDSIENFRRASIMQAFNPAATKKKRDSSFKKDSISLKPKEKLKDSGIPTVVLEDRDELIKRNMDYSSDSSEGPDDEVNFETQKGLQRLRTQSLAAIAAIEADEDSDDEARRLVDILNAPDMRKFVEYGDLEEDLDALRDALDKSEMDDQLVKDLVVAIYDKTSSMKLSKKEAEQIFKPQEEELEDEIIDVEAPLSQNRETPKEKKVRERVEGEVKNIRAIVEMLRDQLKELKDKSDGFETLGGIKPNKLKNIKSGIDDSLKMLKEEPMPDPGCISEIKKVTKNTDSAIPKPEEQTAKSVAETEEMEALLKAINKNTDQLAMNMTDVAEYKMMRSAQDLCHSGRVKNVDLQAPQMDGQPPKNSEKLTDDDRNELKRYLDKLKEAVDGVSSVANEW